MITRIVTCIIIWVHVKSKALTQWQADRMKEAIRKNDEAMLKVEAQRAKQMDMAFNIIEDAANYRTARLDAKTTKALANLLSLEIIS